MTTTPNPIPTNVLMTLSGLAATAATPRPSGETSDVHAARIWAGIDSQLLGGKLATGTNWVVQWLALTPGNANLVYIAQCTSQNALAVVVRGTAAELSDIAEDLGVGSVVAFQVSSSSAPVTVAKGSMSAFTQVMSATSSATSPGGFAGQNLMQVLTSLITLSPSAPTVYVTGHSLGGAVATMLALYLPAQSWPKTPTFQMCTFAAPTAGLADFATALGNAYGSNAMQMVNTWDVVPQAWNNLSDVSQNFFPSPGPAATFDVKALIGVIGKATNGYTYVQPCTQSPVNQDKTYYPDPSFTNNTMEDFMAQVGAQHANNQYLTLLGAPTLPSAPVVTSLSATTFASSGGILTITGSGFDSNCVVDFGIVAAQAPTSITPTAITVAVPPGFGIANVTVTNNLGTSPATPISAFAYAGPEPVVVTSISPTSGKWTIKGTSVTIYGSGFGDSPVVSFGSNNATVTSISDKQLTVTVPMSGTPLSTTVDVTVTAGVATSPASPADEFTYLSN